MYARGMGMRGKTDRLDAQVLARYIAHEHGDLRPWQPQPPAQRALDELIRRRATIVKAQQALRMSSADSPVLEAAMAPAMKEFTRLLATIDSMIAAAAGALSAQTRDFECITSVPGNRAAVGLDAAGRVSAARRSRRRCGSSPSWAWTRVRWTRVKRAACAACPSADRPNRAGFCSNAAMSASRTAAWKAQYEHERAKHLPRTAALNVLARKLVRVAFSLFKSHSLFDQSLVATK